MTKKEVEELFELEEGTLILEPCDIYGEAIIGVSEDRKHLIYDYFDLVCALQKSYMKEDKLLEEDAYFASVEWLQYNTLRSLPYMNSEYKPIIILSRKHFEENK